MSKRIVVIIVLVMLVFSYIPVSAGGEDNGKILGVVPINGSVSSEGGGGLLTYHSGPVMNTNKVYAIFWIPSGYTMAPGYLNLITRYFKDVAAASGTSSNVYYSDNQYYAIYSGVTSYITYDSQFGGYYKDTAALPASGCALYNGLTDCLTDVQIRTEIKRVIALKSWVANSTTAFFMFTPAGVGSCYATGQCAFTQYCGYHSWSNKVLYSNMPYTGSDLGACGVPQSPNNNFDADSTLSVTSHEHNEMITDPRGTGWFDAYGNENGDKCAWNFGAVSAGHKYNQSINGHNYILQKEWSNMTVRCVLTGS